MRKRAVIIIPARYASNRLPGKPLVKVGGKPMIQRVYERALQIRNADQVLIVTDDERIRSAITAFQANAMMSPSDIQSGSERVGFAANSMDAEIIVNLQGDEPFFPVEAVEEAIDALQNNPELQISTLAGPLTSEDEWHDPSIVKVLTDRKMNAIYFSRTAVPFFRGGSFKPLPCLLKHIGVYVFRKNFLMQYLNWKESALEEAEKLEQLRILENGYRIRVVKTEKSTFGIDTPEDVVYIESFIKNKRNEL